jgi:glycosyltransferase involved in cell wall biosynthesis
MKQREISIALAGQQPRGHVADLVNHPPPDISYVFKNVPTDVRHGKAALHTRSKLSIIGRSKVANKIGLFLPVLKWYPSYIDVVLALNRFYMGNRPSISWLERPAAPLHYEPSKLNNVISRSFVQHLLKNPRRFIVCWSNACAKEFISLYHMNNIESLRVVPPMVIPPKDFLQISRAISRQKNSTLKFLFVGSLFHVKGGKETITAFECIQNTNSSVQLTIVSELDSVGPVWMSRIEGNPSIRFIRSTVSRDEMWKIYDAHHVLIHPTQYDSFGLVVLEAMRMGIPVVACSVYCIPEIINSDCGILLKHPHVDDGMIGYAIPGDDSEAPPNENLVSKIVEAMKILLDVENRIPRATNAFKRGEAQFGEAYLNGKWTTIIHTMLKLVN